MGAVSLPVIFLPEARPEFDDAYDWYENQRAGLGEAFADQVQRVLDRVAVRPRMHAVVPRGVRKSCRPESEVPYY